MPRAFSSGSRSVSTPVSARTSAVLPWSMWPGGAERERRRPSRERARHGPPAPERLVLGRACAGRAARGRPRCARRAAARAAARRARGPGSPGEPARPGPASSSSGSAPPPTRPTASTTPRRRTARRALGPRARRSTRRRALSIASTAARGARARVAVEASVASSAARRACRCAPRGRAGGGGRRRPRRGGRPGARLRPAEQLVAAEADDGGARGTERRTSGSPASSGEVVGQRARADVVDHRHRSERAQRLDRDLLDEPDGAEVRRVRAQDRGGLAAERRARSRRGACGWSCRPRPAAPRPARSRRGCGSRRRSRPAGRARRPRGSAGPSAASASSVAAALLLTTSAASAPVSARSSAAT